MKDLLIGTLLLVLAFGLSYLNGTGDPLIILIGIKESHMMAAAALFLGVLFSTASCHLFDVRATVGAVLSLSACISFYIGDISILWGVGFGILSIMIFAGRTRNAIKRIRHKPDLQ